jgi:hypothetical protein
VVEREGPSGLSLSNAPTASGGPPSGVRARALGGVWQLPAAARRATRVTKNRAGVGLIEDLTPWRPRSKANRERSVLGRSLPTRAHSHSRRHRACSDGRGVEVEVGMGCKAVEWVSARVTSLLVTGMLAAAVAATATTASRRTMDHDGANSLAPSGGAGTATTDTRVKRRASHHRIFRRRREMVWRSRRHPHPAVRAG